jgi:hypothetical protein
MMEACDLVNYTHTSTWSGTSNAQTRFTKKYFNLRSRSLVKHAEECGILPFDSMFPSDHIPLCVDFNIVKLFGHPVIGTTKSALRDLQLDNPRLIDAYESTLCKQLENHNVELRVATLFAAADNLWNTISEAQFNQVDRNITRAMECAVNKC